MSNWACIDFDSACGRGEEEVVETTVEKKVVKAAKKTKIQEEAAEARNDRSLAEESAVQEIKKASKKSKKVTPVEEESREPLVVTEGEEEKRPRRRWFGGRKKKVQGNETEKQPEIEEDKIAALEREESKDLEDLVVKPRLSGSSLTSLLHEKRQLKAFYHHFGTKPRDLVQVEQDKEDKVPEPEGADHVIVKVQVS